MMPASTIHEDVPDTGLIGDDAVADAFLKRWKDAPEGPSGDSKDEESKPEAQEETEEPEGEEEETTEAEAEEEGEDPEEGSEEETEEEETEASDDAKVVIKVGDQEHRVSVADLKRLYGQEKALTQKSQEVAQLRGHFDQRVTLVQSKLTKLIDAAKQRFDALDGVNMAVLARRQDVTEEDLRAFDREHKAAKADLDYLLTEQQEVSKEVGEEQARRHQEAVQTSVKALTDEKSPYFIPDLKTAYPKLLDYGVKSGIPPEVMARETSPIAFHVLHKAMLYDQTQTEKTKVKIKPKVKVTSKRVSKPGSGEEAGERPDLSKAKAKLRRSGRAEDAADLFLAKWAR